jgi:hypothetical protein
MTRADHSFLASPPRLVAVWCLLLLVACAALAAFQHRALVAELEHESTALHALASQRADQHDAHMTALSAVAVAAAKERQGLFLDVAATITRLYPRIDEVQLVPLDPAGPAIGIGSLAPQTAEVVRAAVARDGSTKVLLKADNSGPHTGTSAAGRSLPRPLSAATRQAWPNSSPPSRRTRACATWILAWSSRPADCRSSSARRWSAASASAAHPRATSMPAARSSA